jgi:hypothetical protein
MVGTSILGSWNSHWFFGTKKTPPFFKSDWMDDLGFEVSQLFWAQPMMQVSTSQFEDPKRSGKKTIPSGDESYMEKWKKLELMLKA